MGRRRKQTGPLDLLSTAFEAATDLLELYDHPAHLSWNRGFWRRRPYSGSGFTQRYMTFSILLLLGAIFLYAYLKTSCVASRLASRKLKIALAWFCAYTLVSSYVVSSWQRPFSRQMQQPHSLGEVLHRAKQMSQQQIVSSRPNLIDLGPSALVKTLLALFAVPILSNLRGLPAVIMAVQALLYHGIGGLTSSRSLWSCSLRLAAFRRLLTLTAFQALPIVLAGFAVLQRARIQRISNPCNILAASYGSKEIVTSKEEAPAIPAFEVCMQCPNCSKRKHIVYDSYGYPVD